MNTTPLQRAVPALAIALMLLSIPAGPANGQPATAEVSASTAAAPPGGAPSVDEIVDHANRAAYYQGQDGRAKVAMTITDQQGRTRSREFTILRWDAPPPEGSRATADEYCADQKFYVYFQRPADVNKMVFMVWKHTDRDDDRWLYLPALDLVKRIASGEKRTSFVGSDFFYEDVSGRNINDDVHVLDKVTDNYFVLKNTPKNPASVEFAHYVMWIHRESFIPIKIEYYDAQGRKYREYDALKVDTIDGYPTVTESRMKDLRTGSETTLAYSEVRYNLGVPEDIFTERYLRKPPTEFLK